MTPFWAEVLRWERPRRDGKDKIEKDRKALQRNNGDEDKSDRSWRRNRVDMKFLKVSGVRGCEVELVFSIVPTNQTSFPSGICKPQHTVAAMGLAEVFQNTTLNRSTDFNASGSIRKR